jgi:GMP synthase (glutamine-hydrolysing)
MRVLSIVHADSDPPGLFAKVARELGHRCDEWWIASLRDPPAPLDEYSAVGVFGGFMNVHDEDRLPWLRAEKRWIRRILEERMPAFGICLGAQLLAEAAGAEIPASEPPEIGWRTIELLPGAGGDALFASVDQRPTVFEWHSWSFGLPPGGIPLASSAVGLQAFRLEPATWGIQFHAEMTPDKLTEWLDAATTDPEALRAGVDAVRERKRSRRCLPASIQLGEELCGRFLAFANAIERVGPAERAVRPGHEPPLSASSA